MAESESKRLSGLIEYYIAKHLAGRKLQGVYFLLIILLHFHILNQICKCTILNYNT